MIFKYSNIKIFGALIVAFTFYFLLFTFSSAQQAPSAGSGQAPELMVTWKSNNYAPASFQGKILPIDGSQIEMALEIIDNGKIANLSNSEISWLINSNELKHGVGLKNISFTAEGFKGDQSIDITIKKYGGQDLTKTATIPLASPEVVIAGGPTLFEALPYFFNIQDISLLRFSWTANGIVAMGLVNDPSKLSLDLSNLPLGSEVAMSVTAQNMSIPTELAAKSINIQK